MIKQFNGGGDLRLQTLTDQIIELIHTSNKRQQLTIPAIIGVLEITKLHFIEQAKGEKL